MVGPIVDWIVSAPRIVGRQHGNSPNRPCRGDARSWQRVGGCASIRIRLGRVIKLWGDTLIVTDCRRTHPDEHAPFVRLKDLARPLSYVMELP